jgi:hypothetical protein
LQFHLDQNGFDRFAEHRYELGEIHRAAFDVLREEKVAMAPCLVSWLAC